LLFPVARTTLLKVLKENFWPTKMKIKSLQSGPEMKTQEVLDRTLSGSLYRAVGPVGMKDVLELESRDSLSFSHEDRNFYMTAHFDFVIYERQGTMPVFAIEFDGPLHEDPVQIKRDIRKNRLCQLANFPLLRVGYAEIEEQDRYTLLDFILRRFLHWSRERGKIIEEINECVAQLSPEEIETLTKDGVLDPSLDSGFRFNIKYPFPGIDESARRLLRRFRIATDYLPSNVMKKESLPEKHLHAFIYAGGASNREGYYVTSGHYTLYEREPGLKGLRWKGGHLVTPGVKVITEGQVDFGMKWALPIAEDYKADEVPVDYFLKTGKLPIVFSEVPGGVHSLHR